MNFTKIYFLIILIIFISGCTSTNNSSEVSKINDECKIIWCVDSLNIKDNKLEINFKDTYHGKTIKRKNGSEYDISDNNVIEYLETNDQFICYGDHESEVLTLKSINQNIAVVKITEDSWPPGVEPGTNELTKECKIHNLYQNQ